MGTRALIGYNSEDGWRAVYHHWDGYPSGLGAELHERYQKCNDLAQLIKEVITGHPSGWSTLMGDKPECYCHDRGESEDPLWTAEDLEAANRDGIDIEYVYTLFPMHELGRPMMNVEDCRAGTLRKVYLDRPLPKWMKED